MKKIFLTLALSALALSGFAQAQQNYVRVEFNVPMTSYDDPKSDKSGTAVASGMPNDYVYCNPAHQYLDFNVTDHPFSYRSTTNTFNEYSYYYLHQVHNTQTYVEDNTHQYKYQVDKITSMTTYSIPVETVKLLSAPADTIPQKFHYVGDNKDYMVGEFTFNRLPRNVAELKTLIEPNGDGKRVHCHNPMYIAAVMYLVWPRLLDCSQDCRDMVDYLFGKFNKEKVETYGISNRSFQNICTATYNGNFGHDKSNKYWDHNHLFEFFKGALPSNQYKPNGKGYGCDDGPYTVYVAWDNTAPVMRSGDLDCQVYTFNLISDPHLTDKADLAFDTPEPQKVMVRDTKKHGCFFYSNVEMYYARGKDQK